MSPEHENSKLETLSVLEKTKTVSQQELFNTVNCSADILEEEIIEDEGITLKRKLKFAGLAGRLRDVTYAIALTLASSGTSSLVYGADSETENIDKLNQSVSSVSGAEKDSSLYTKRSPEFRSSKYNEMLHNLKMKLESAGVTSYSSDSTSPEDYKMYERYLDVVNSQGSGANELNDAIFKHNRSLQYNKTVVGKVEVDPLDWESSLSKINYPSALSETAYEFGVDPYKRIGYQKDKQFNFDVLQITENLNKRLDSLNKKTGKSYPLIDAGLIASVALQEGFAKVIDDKGGYGSDLIINNYIDIGLDSLSEDLPNLEKKGLITEGFKDKLLVSQVVTLAGEIFGRDAYKTKNEQRMKAERLNGKAKDFLEGIGAALLEKRNTVIDAIGEKYWDKFSHDEQQWISYSSYQYGPSKTVRLILEGIVTVRATDKEFKFIPITNYPKYHDGKIIGNVSNIHDFIYRNHGRKYRATRLSDFHHMASQVAVSARISNDFFKVINR